jgi:radical SAM superfamily enzyme YgiQ (UPF0313 family)
VSSLRADRLDAETVGLLAKTGCEVLTVAADGGSERLRQEIGKEVTEADLVRCAELARDAGMNALKVYAMVGLPGETEEDIRELALLANRLHRIRPVVLSLAVFVPKRFTPLAGAEFGPVGAVAERLRLLRRGCSGGVRLGRVSAREAAVEHWLSHATAADAEKIIAVARTPARVQDWGRVIGQ